MVGHFTVLAFWPFASAWMLLWGLAAVVPLLIHLWSRRRYREVSWAAMEYLLAALRKNSRRLRLEQWLLLVVRTAILLLLAIALADPALSLFPAFGGGAPRGGQNHLVLVIDGSYSMDYRGSEKSHFETAQQWASQVVQQSTQGDGFTLLLMADPPRVIIGEPAFDPADVVEEIESLRLLHGEANLAATLGELEQILAKARQLHPRLAQHKVCFFSDLGRTTWDDAQSDDCRRRAAGLAEHATLALFDVGQPGRQNLAVTRLAMGEPLVTVGRDVTFEVEVQNFGSQDRARQRLDFLVEDQAIHVEHLDVRAGDRASVTWRHRFDTPGEHMVQVVLEDDSLPVDNRRWLSVPVRETIRVLCIEGRPGAARHVAWALQPSRTDRPRVRPDLRPESALLELDLNQYDCLVLCNVGRFGRNEASVLHNYLHNGGGLVVFLGDQVQADNYNLELGGEVSGKRVLPARIGQTMGQAQYEFDPLEYRHPIVAPFRSHQQAGLLTTPVWKYFQLEPHEPDVAQVALAFHGGDPAIIEESILRGRSILVATAASPESVDRSVQPPTPWTALSTWPSFPPLVQEMLSLAVSGRTEHRNLAVGQPLEASVHTTIADLALDVVGPDGRSERVPLKIEGEDSRWTYQRTDYSGVYQARYGPPLSGTQPFAVNVDTRQSSLERADPELLPSQFRQDFEVDAAGPSLPVPPTTSFFRYLLAAVLVLVLGETLLAWYFGNASR